MEKSLSFVSTPWKNGRLLFARGAGAGAAGVAAGADVAAGGASRDSRSASKVSVPSLLTFGVTVKTTPSSAEPTRIVVCLPSTVMTVGSA